MRYIHPFPARMAPEVALDKLQSLKPGQIVLDPMVGSGMVLSQAARIGINAVGIDLDPLAELISRVGASQVDEDEVNVGVDMLLERCSIARKKTYLSWVDGDLETAKFIDFWYAPKQREQLRKLSFHLIVEPIEVSDNALALIKVALSRLIVTKEPKASLARDTAHSRPHKTIHSNDFDVFNAMRSSVAHALNALDSPSIKTKAVTFLGDARNLVVVPDDAVDCIVTSPPYLNAIDYMRGHRMSLVWLGYRLRDLRQIRGVSIGAERALCSVSLSQDFPNVLAEIGLENLENRTKNMLGRYFFDLIQQTKEAFRVLKSGALATYVIGNSTIRGTYVRNSDLLKIAGALAGFQITNETQRMIPAHQRYMPITVDAENSLARRMHTENIIDFRKVA